MSSFSPLERAISGFLGRSPTLRAQIKGLYQRLNFLLYGERGFDIWLASGVRISTPSELIGIEAAPPDIAEFFGYFDATPWSADGRYYVVNQTRNIHGGADVVLYDLLRKTRQLIGSTPLATWQQGTMCRWLAHRQVEYLTYNTVEAGIMGTRLFCPADSTTRFLPLPLQAVNQPYSKIYALNYLRLQRNGTEYGYQANCVNLSCDLPDANDGIWTVDIATGTQALIISLEQLQTIQPSAELQAATNHEINHLSVAPGGNHFVFIHRFRGAQGQFSRMYACQHDGTELRLLLDEHMVSHYAWLDSAQLIVWARTLARGDRYYIVNALTGAVQPFPDVTINRWGDGHPSYHHGNHWLVTDSYPDRKRQQHLLLVNPTGHCSEVARFFLPLRFSAGHRVDLHPRWSLDGRWISIDSGFSGVRRNYVLDVSALLEAG